MKSLRMILLLLLTLPMMACARGVIKTENIADLTEKVVRNHDRYVERDAALDPIKRNDLLIESFRVRALVKREEVLARDLGPPLWPIILRLEVYLRDDKKIGKVLKRTRLRSCDLLREILKEAGWQGG